MKVISFPKANYGIYEWDIVYLGGKVIYTGNVISKSRYSIIEDATVCLDGNSCVARMQRFSHGNAVILGFVRDGSLLGYDDSGLGICVEKFLDALSIRWCGDDDFVLYSFFRHLKQYAVVFLQIVAVFAFIGSLLVITLEKNNSIYSVILLISSVFMFFLMSNFYKYIRVAPIKKHK